MASLTAVSTEAGYVLALLALAAVIALAILLDS